MSIDEFNYKIDSSESEMSEGPISVGKYVEGKSSTNFDFPEWSKYAFAVGLIVGLFYAGSGEAQGRELNNSGGILESIIKSENTNTYNLNEFKYIR